MHGSIVSTTYSPDVNLPVNTNWRLSGACCLLTELSRSLPQVSDQMRVAALAHS